ncbi:helix-turn-helix domain-containing protein [Kitasatospora sp. NPDC093806]|uniref:helix-turn-helix domain-containing protein n=1 Tax=Kitasatospora sp. NPDC093806 TaxID=3155075 RepID=UPI00341E0216
MLRIHFTPEDFARVRLAPRPAPLQELNAALTMMCRRGDDLLHGPWRRRALRALPKAAGPLADLVPAGLAPGFLDVPADSLPEALETTVSAPAGFVRAELERVYRPARRPAPPWIHDLGRGDAEARRLVGRAQRSAFEALLGPVWGQVQDLHHAEFVRRAVQLAEGVGPVLAGLLPGARLHGSVWELPGPPRTVHLGGRGLLLLPTFHWFDGPLLSDLPDRPDRPAVVTYPAAPGLLPPHPDGPAGPTDPRTLGRVLGDTRAELLRLLADEHTTTDLARRLHLSPATVSAHTTALRAAGLISTTRAGKSVLHHRTPLATLLLGPPT